MPENDKDEIDNSEENKSEVCNHDWVNDDTSEIEREGDFIGFHVHCTLCRAKAIEWFEYSYTEIKKE